MLTPRTPRRLISCLLLLLVSLSSSGESRPHAAWGGGGEGGGGAPGGDGMDGAGPPLLEAVKTGILRSLGMDREPRPAKKASEQELRTMFQLYREKLKEMRGNSSLTMRETWKSTVLFPATVEPVKVQQQQSDQHMQWYKAVFYRNPNLQTEMTLTRAELKISRQILNEPASDSDMNQEIKVKVCGVKPVNSAAWTHLDPLVQTNVSHTQDVVLDISPEVERWMKADGRLVVDVGVIAGEGDAVNPIPTFSLELDLTEPERRRRRSNKEDDCDERGWCCRKSVTVSFKDIGWTDWVVAPAEYTMRFCDGTCPHNYKPASMHTQVKSRMHQITKGRTPRPCCVPAAYEPMVLMHYDSRDNLKLTPFEDLIVSKCHCA